MPDDDAPPPRSAWRLTSIIVVLLLVVMLVGVLLPLVGMVDRPPRPSMCGKNMSQLLGAMIAYSTAEDGVWPLATPMPARRTMDAHAARQVTCRMFAVLARSQSLPMDLFRCPPSRRPAPPALAGVPTPVDWGMSEAGVVGYAMDWACPADPGSARVVMADRDPLAHDGAVMACFGDCHVKKLKIVPVPANRARAVLVTEGSDSKPITGRVGNPDAGGDDIYSDEGDADVDLDPEYADFLFDQLVPGQGHPQRAWVK
jgi:hypothetical protein